MPLPVRVRIGWFPGWTVVDQVIMVTVTTTPSRTTLDQDRLRPYVPRLVVDWLRTSPEQTWREVDGSLAFVDISGFTTLTEKLSRHGRIGAEEISDTLSSTFAALLTVAYEDGAGLVKWGGDAVLLLFEGDLHAARAARAAFRMRQTMRRIGTIDTTAGKVTLRMSVGVHSGRFHFFFVGDPALHRELLVSGPAASICAEVEGIATAGQIGLSPQTAAELAPSLSESTPQGIYLLTGKPDVPITPAPPPPATSGLDLASTLSAPVREHLLANIGEPEHRNVAVAFVQFSGTDELLVSAGPEALAGALDECIRNVQEAADRHGVTFFETDINRDGGKIMLIAGAPRTAGNNAERMLLATRLVLDRPGLLPLRIGVNSGGVFSGDFGPAFRRTYSVKGDAINLAARVMGKAAPGQLLATTTILGVSPTRFQLELLAPFMVKGKALPVEAASVGPVIGHDGGAGSHEVPLIGREKELSALRDALEAARQREGRVVELIGEPGIGKSRLVEELRADAADVVQLTAACEEYEAQTPYFPFRALLREAAGLAAHQDPAAILRRLTDRVAPDRPDLVPWLPLLGVPLDVTLPETQETSQITERFRRNRIADVTAQFLDAVLPTSTLLVVDDAHLMDEASADLLHQLLAARTGRPWLVLVTRRDRATGFVPKALVDLVSIRPGPLEPDAAAALFVAAAGEDALPPHQTAAILDRAGGNPLFLRSLVEAARSGDIGAELPDSVESLVTAQLDRLPTEERTLLRFASVLGVTFGEDQLREMLRDHPLPTGRATMRRLSAFLEPAGHGRFRFHNEVVRDTAYRGLSFRRRQELHGRVGEVLEHQGSDPDEQAELLSLHYYHSGHHDKAWRYSRVAGHRSRAKYAYAEATEFYRRALEAARRLPTVHESELAEVHEAMGDAMHRVGGYDAARSSYRAARRHRRDDPLAAADLLLKESLQTSRQGKHSQALRVLTSGLKLLAGRDDPAALGQRSKLESNYAFARYEQGRYRDAQLWGLRAEADAIAATDDAALAEAYVVLQAVGAWSGYGKNEPYGERALALYDRLGDRLQRAHVLNNMAGGAFFEGRWSDALTMFEQAHVEYEAAGDVFGATTATFNVADIEWRQRRYQEAEAKLRQVRRTARGLGEPELVALAERELGRTLVLSGRADDGLGFLESALAEFVSEGAGYEQLVTETAMVEYFLCVGQPATARERCEAAMARAQSLDATTLLPTFGRLHGEALLALGQPVEAEAELSLTLAALDGLGAHERGFLLLDLTRARDALGATDVIDLRDQAQVELGRLGVVVSLADSVPGTYGTA